MCNEEEDRRTEGIMDVKLGVDGVNIPVAADIVNEVTHKVSIMFEESRT